MKTKRLIVAGTMVLAITIGIYLASCEKSNPSSSSVTSESISTSGTTERSIAISEYWIEEISRETFLNSIQNNQTITIKPSDLLPTIKHIFEFKNNQINEYLLLNTNLSVIVVSVSDGDTTATTNYSFTTTSSNSNSKQHLLKAIDKQNGVTMLDATFTEDFQNNKLSVKNLPLENFHFSQQIIKFNHPPTEQQRSICCSLCAGVHSALGISALDCFCCFFGNGCGFGCDGI